MDEPHIFKMSDPHIIRIIIPGLDVNPEMRQFVKDFSDRINQKYGDSIFHEFKEDPCTHQTLIILIPILDTNIEKRQFINHFCDRFKQKYSVRIFGQYMPVVPNDDSAN